MSLSFTHTRLMVSDMAASIHFYRDVLGLELHTRTEDDIYVEFKASPAILSLYRRELMSEIVGTTHLPPLGSAQDGVLIWFGVENVDAFCERLHTHGVTLVAPPTDRPAWGLRTAHFRDPDGHLIEIGHGIPMA